MPVGVATETVPTLLGWAVIYNNIIYTI